MNGDIPFVEHLEFFFLVASILMILGLRMLTRVESARRGNVMSATGMLVGVAAVIWFAFVSVGSLQFSSEVGKAFLLQGIVPVAVALLIGGLIGLIAAQRIKMTGMPELVALFNGFGGLASLGLAGSEGLSSDASLTWLTICVIFGTIAVGGACFSGSVMAFGKLSGRVGGGSYALPLHSPIMWLLLLAIAGLALLTSFSPLPTTYAILAVTLISLLLGILLVMRVGGADMPIVISLLNSFSGVAAAMAGFVVGNIMLVVAGALVGASGLILTQIMTKAMNRSLLNVLLGGMAADQKKSKEGSKKADLGEAKSIGVEDAYYLFEAARSVVIVPGYGLAVAQAQHGLKELADLLGKNGAEVRYAIHPVAGRMPGHMNVLLAEANVPYEAMVEPDDVNPAMEAIDLAIVVGANDVVNPDAKEDPSSPLFGMPIIEVHRATNVVVLKRSMAAGFSGVENTLFYLDNSRMLFGNAKDTLSALAGEFKE